MRITVISRVLAKPLRHAALSGLATCAILNNFLAITFLSMQPVHKTHRHSLSHGWLVVADAIAVVVGPTGQFDQYWVIFFESKLLSIISDAVESTFEHCLLGSNKAGTFQGLWMLLQRQRNNSIASLHAEGFFWNSLGARCKIQAWFLALTVWQDNQLSSLKLAHISAIPSLLVLPGQQLWLSE